MVSGRHIITEARKENSTLQSQIKVLESEAKIHITEIAELREVSLPCLEQRMMLISRAVQSMNVLENTLQETIEKEEKALDDEDGRKPPSETVEGGEAQLAIIKSLKVRPQPWLYGLEY